MNKMTVAVLSLLSVAMFFGIANAGAVPDGFAEVPWGASRAQVEKNNEREWLSANYKHQTWPIEIQGGLRRGAMYTHISVYRRFLL
jgi:hypothetical protein